MISIQFILVFYMVHLTVFSILNVEKQKSIKILSALCFIALVALDIGRYLSDGYHTVQVYDSPLSLGLIIVLILYSIGSFKRLSMWIAVASSLLIIVSINTVSAGFILPIFGFDTRFLSVDPFLSVLGLVSGLILLTLLYLLIKKVNLPINIYSLTRVDVITILLFLIMFGYYIANMQTLVFYNITPFRSILNVLTMLVGLVPIYFIIYIITQKDYIHEMKLKEENQELLFESQLAHYEIMRGMDLELKKFQHDISDELNHLEYLAREGDINEMLNHISLMQKEKSEINNLRTFNTGLNCVNSSWYNLISDEKYKNIEYEWLGKIPPNLAIDTRDAMKLFANLLKNAFEAAKCAEVSKYVKVHVYFDKNEFRIIIHNSHANKLIPADNGIFVTTKDNKNNHGIGTKIIKDIVTKYNGSLSHEYTDTEFIVKVAFGSNVVTSHT